MLALYSPSFNRKPLCHVLEQEIDDILCHMERIEFSDVLQTLDWDDATLQSRLSTIQNCPHANGESIMEERQEPIPLADTMYHLDTCRDLESDFEGGTCVQLDRKDKSALRTFDFDINEEIEVKDKASA
jgi:hypothetical protein